MERGLLSCGTRLDMDHVRGSVRMPHLFEDDEQEELTPEELAATDWMILKDLSPEQIDNWLSYGSPLPFREYNPLRFAGLHREFAEISYTAEGVLTFASKYGFMGFNTQMLKRESQVIKRCEAIGEPLQEWYAEIAGVGLLLSLYDQYSSPNSADHNLQSLVWISGGAVSFEPEAMLHRGMEATGWMYQDILLPLRSPEQKLADWDHWGARFLLEGLLSYALAQLAAPKFSAVPGGQITLVPNSLLGAIYVHFVQEVLGRADPLTRCAGCGKWFVARHASKMYSSHACKQKAYRRNKEKTING